MKLHNLTANNFQILRDINLNLGSRPITLIAADNEQGKTSLVDALILAFTGRATRVGAKKDYGQLVLDGAKKGQVSVEWEDGRARVNLPSGSHLSEGAMPAAIEYVLQAGRFSSLTPDARRTFLFGLLDAKIGAEELSRRLLEKGHALDKVVACELPSGAPAAHKTAKGKASEARAAWKAITNEVYGEVKAESWAPAEVAFDAAALDTARETLAGVDLTVSTLTQAQGAYRVHKEQAAARERRIAGLRETASHHARMVNKLATDEAGLSEAALKLEESRVAAGLLPKKSAPADLMAFVAIARQVMATVSTTQLVSTLSGEFIPWDGALIVSIQNALDEYQKHYGASVEPDAETRELASKVADREAAYTLMKNSVANDQRYLTAAELAAKELAELTTTEETPVPTSPEADLAIARASQEMVRKEVARLEMLERGVASREAHIEKARGHHADVKTWEALADDLAPDGIPCELLRDALRPFNGRLRETAMATGWKQTSITDDMGIWMDGRDYALGSETARWKADAAIAEAISHLSGTKILIIDRMDVLSLSNRGTFMEWIDTLVADGMLDTVLICATLKELPQGFPDTWSLHWLENGVLYDTVQQQQAA